MAMDRRVLAGIWILALAVGLLVTIGLPAALTLMSDLIWWR
jgi:hypothetical protein